MNAKQHINKIKLILDEPNETATDGDFAIYQFKYTRNIKNINDVMNKLKTNSCISITGRDKITRYENAFQNLYDEMEIYEQLLSYMAFKNLCEQLIFEDKFSKKDIIAEISAMPANRFINIAVVYGVKLESKYKKLGKYLVINKDNIFNFLRKNLDKEKNKHDYDWIKGIGARRENDETNLVYCVCENIARDREYSDYLFKSDKNNFINIIRYMAGLKHEMVYVDLIKFVDYRQDKIQITNRIFLPGMSIKRKDIFVLLDDNFFTSRKNGNYYIWEITKKDSLTQLDKRILKSIEWISLSVNEANNDVACTEIAIAFESLLKVSESGSPISSGIKIQISETVAFLVGNAFEERIELAEKFKKIYNFRSAIVHGKDINKAGDYFEYLYMFKDVVTAILTKKSFRECDSFEQIYEKIKKIKFS